MRFCYNLLKDKNKKQREKMAKESKKSKKNIESNIKSKPKDSIESSAENLIESKSAQNPKERQKEQGIIEFLKTANAQEIQRYCQKRFLQNMEFFAAKYPTLCEAMQRPPTDFSMLFDERGLNIVNIKNGALLYELSDGKSTMLALQEECAKNPPTNPRWARILGSELGLMEKDFPTTALMTDKLVEECAKFGLLKDGFHLPSRFLPQISLYGLGGGIFLQDLVENYDYIHTFLIFEENLDMFRCACYFVDFARLFDICGDQNGYIFIESLIDRKKIQQYFTSRRISSTILRFELSLYSGEQIEAVRNLADEFHKQTLRGWGTFEDEMRGLKNKCALNIEKIMSRPKRVNAPICVCGNGPSLEDCFKFIKKNKDKMVIISCGTAIKPLLKAGIKPDFQIEIERHNYLGEALQNAPLGDIPLIGASVLDINAKKIAKELYLFERDGASAADIFEPAYKLFYASPLVGNAGAAFAAAIGSDIILCGIDCGIKQGRTMHAKGSYYGEEKAQIPEDYFQTDGNFSQDIWTNSLFSLSRSSYERCFESAKVNEVLNLSDGVFIKGARPTKPDEFDLREIDKKAAIEGIKSCFVNPKEVNFYSKNAEYYINSTKSLAQEILNIFSIPTTSKKDVFKQIDKIHNIIADTANHKDPVAAILLGGSVGHFCFAIAQCVIRTPQNDISQIWGICGKLYANSIDQMLKQFAELIAQKDAKQKIKKLMLKV